MVITQYNQIGNVDSTRHRRYCALLQDRREGHHPNAAKLLKYTDDIKLSLAWYLPEKSNSSNSSRVHGSRIRFADQI